MYERQERELYQALNLFEEGYEQANEGFKQASAGIKQMRSAKLKIYATIAFGISYQEESSKLDAQALKNKIKKSPVGDKSHLDNLIKKIKKDPNAIFEYKEILKMALMKIKGLCIPTQPRTDGRWMGQWFEDGRYKSFYAKTIEDLLIKAIKVVKGEIRLGATKPKKCLSFEGWTQKWLAEYHKPNVSENTYKTDCQLFKKHFFPMLGQKQLKDLQNVDIQKAINACPAPRQRQVNAQLIIACLRTAHYNNLIDDITKGIKIPKHDIKETLPFTQAQEKILLSALKGHSLEPFIILLLNSGLRRNEALGLQWKHFDFKNDIIIIEQQLDQNGSIIKTLKTKQSKRIVKMFPIIRKVFEPLACDSDSMVFNFSPERATKNFKNLLISLKMPNYSIKSCRTTFATRCAEMGIAIKVVQSWMGHAKANMTVDVYQKATVELIEKEFNKVKEANFDIDFDIDS